MASNANTIANTATIVDQGNTIASVEIDVPLELNCLIVKSTTFTGNAKSGSTIHWKVVITNPNALIAKTNIPFSDTLDTKTTYVTGTFKVNNTVTTPATTTPALTYTIPTIAALAVITIEFDALVS